MIKEHAPALFEAARALVGRQILKADGSLRKDALVVLELPTFDEHNLSIYRNSSNYSLSFTFKVSEWTENTGGMSDHTEYAERTVYLGDMSNGVLNDSKEFDPTDYKSDYTIEGIQMARMACLKARKAYEKARSACNPFGEGR